MNYYERMRRLNTNCEIHGVYSDPGQYLIVILINDYLLNNGRDPNPSTMYILDDHNMLH